MVKKRRMTFSCPFVTYGYGTAHDLRGCNVDGGRRLHRLHGVGSLHRPGTLRGTHTSEHRLYTMLTRCASEFMQDVQRRLLSL
jgi:hypothetical protein